MHGLVGDAWRRPREKIHRPQTRRRRENNEDSVDKLKAIRANLVATRELAEALTRREQRKLNLLVGRHPLQPQVWTFRQ